MILSNLSLNEVGVLAAMMVKYGSQENLQSFSIFKFILLLIEFIYGLLPFENALILNMVKIVRPRYIRILLFESNASFMGII